MKEYLKYRIRYIFIVSSLSVLLFFSLFLILTEARYESRVDLNARLDIAKHIINPGTYSFKLSMNDIIPRNEPYVYTFFLSNYDENNQSDVDMDYNLFFKTTTNMPLRYELYRNVNYTENGAVNLLSDMELIQDVDGAWYNQFNIDDTFSFLYQNRQLDTYYLVIYFDDIYANNLEYADNIDSIKIIVDAKQVV